MHEEIFQKEDLLEGIDGEEKWSKEDPYSSLEDYIQCIYLTRLSITLEM